MTDRPSDESAGPVECLGRLFATEQARREHFTERLRQKLKDPEFRATPGFPPGRDEDILRLSDPPYYTACPNPFLEEAIRAHARDEPGVPALGSVRREPHAADVTAAKSDPIYNAHSYHTKVPPEVIEQLVAHYTDPGDVVLDCFCGSGMTGVACSERHPQGESRYSILTDLSPLATHIAGSLTQPVDPARAGEELEQVLAALEESHGHLYRFDAGEPPAPVTIEYVVWTEWFDCSTCGAPMSFYDALLEHGVAGKLTRFPCPNCGASLNKKKLRPTLDTIADPVLGRRIRTTRTSPVLVVGKDPAGRRVRRPAGERQAHHIEDVLAELADRDSVSVPTVELPFMHMTHERNDLPGKGITHVHHFYAWRSLLLLGLIWRRIRSPWSRLVFTSACDRNATRRNRYVINKHNPTGRVNGPLSNTLYVPPLQVEMNVLSILRRKMADLVRAASKGRPVRRRSAFVSTQSATSLANIPDSSVDYAFVDPPFGGNILYSDLNIVAEAWLGVGTDRGPEAVVDDSRDRGLGAYQHTLTECFVQVRAKLKPGRWLTVEFHNSSNEVWAAIQAALGAAGLVVADVRILDKGSGSIHQDAKSAAMKKDLLISAYRPSEAVETAFRLKTVDPNTVWTFVAEHLRSVPVLGRNSSKIVASERTAQMLLDRMIAYHVRHGVAVPMSAAEFRVGLAERFEERDGMYYLPGQMPA